MVSDTSFNFLCTGGTAACAACTKKRWMSYKVLCPILPFNRHVDMRTCLMVFLNIDLYSSPLDKVIRILKSYPIYDILNV